MPSSVPSSAVENVCLEKARLTAAHNNAAENYSRAVAVLERYLGTMSRDEYEALLEFSERMREQSERARAELQRHIAEHSC